MKIEKPEDTSMFPKGLHRFAALKMSGMRSKRREAILKSVPHATATTRSLYTSKHVLVLASDAETHKLPTVDYAHLDIL
jgi:hypothetical protein